MGDVEGVALNLLMGKALNGLALRIEVGHFCTSATLNINIAFAACVGIDFYADAADLDRFSAHIGSLDGLGGRLACHSR